MEKIAVIGMGYVGLVSGACYAEMGHKVICADNDESKIELLKNVQLPIYEPNLQVMIEKNILKGRLHFSSNISEVVRDSEIVIITVGTPSTDNGDVDLSQVKSVVQEIAKFINEYKIIVIKSTVPAGTAKQVEDMLKQNVEKGIDFDVISNPEFLREGTAIQDTFKMDRLIIGGITQHAKERIKKLHDPLGVPVLFTDWESAEVIKYASNAFLATKISFINEIANICESMGADIRTVSQGMGLDRRIGPYFLNAGIGFGGSCFPKDLKAQYKIAEKFGYEFKIIKSVIEVNKLQPIRFVKKIESYFGGNLRGRKLAIMGLAFKPNTNDLREAPSLKIISELCNRGAEIKAFDPVIKNVDVDSFYTVSDPYETISDCDAMVITTEWDTFRYLDFIRIKTLLKTPTIFDGRNMYQESDMLNMGFNYISIGKA